MGENISLTRHVLTDEERLKKTGKKNPGVKIINSIKNRTHCNQKCKIFWVCPMMALSISRQNPAQTCLLNAGGNVLIRRFINIFATGKKGLENEINSTLYSYGFDIETAPPGIKKDYATMLMTWHKQQYSDPGLLMEQKPNLTVIINEMDDHGKIREIIPVIPLVEAGEIKNTGMNIIAGKMLEDDEKDDGQDDDDPDTLLNSSILKDLFKDLPKPEGTGLSAEERGTTHGKDGRFRRKDGYVSKPDRKAGNDECQGTERESEELAETSGSAGSGS